MAFLLPLVFVGGGMGGFAFGYYLNGANEVQPVNQLGVDITIHDLKILKENSPHKEIHHELVNFNKNNLKKTNSTSNIQLLTKEQEILEDLRQKILNRRTVINPIQFVNI